MVNYKEQSGLTERVHAELSRSVPAGAAVRPKIIRLIEADGQETGHHQLTSTRRPEKGRSVTPQSL